MSTNKATHSNTATANLRIAIIGGGIAGSTIALRLAELGLQVTLLEKGNGLVNGPPICHLHAGGSFYREISDQQCLTLLQQSIDTLRIFPHCANIRPTVIAVPKADRGSPLAILPRLKKLQHHYRDMITADPSLQVLGPADDYFQLFSREQMQALAQLPLPEQPENAEQWMIPLAKQLDFDAIQWPLIQVQEYGLSGFRFAAVASLASEALASCKVLINHRVTHIAKAADGHWQLSAQDHNGNNQQLTADYLINACGFRSGAIDDMVQTPRQRLVEFKAAYVANWPQCQGRWPEVIFHGERGTPQGMAQLTPYPEGYFQLHGMTEDITLFRDGLAASTANSAQPQLPERFIKKIDQGWPAEVVEQRTLGSIGHMAQFIPAFQTARTAAKPLYGAQQIPGDDPSLRAADVSFAGDNYARTEIVKASSALAASSAILQHMQQQGLIEMAAEAIEQFNFPVTQGLNGEHIIEQAIAIAEQRGYPAALAKRI